MPTSPSTRPDCSSRRAAHRRQKLSENHWHFGESDFPPGDYPVLILSGAFFTLT